ncbi:MAG: hypothetical protein ACTHKZ_04650 [Lysobacteraceae bacterium]
MTRAFTRQSHPDMPEPLPAASALPHGQPAESSGSGTLAALRDRLTEAERQLQAIAPDAPGAREERAALREDIQAMQRRLAGAPPR